MDAYKKVINARSSERTRAKEIIEKIFDEYIYLKGDRAYGDSEAIIGGIGSLSNGIKNHRVTFIGIQKGADAEESLRTNFGMPNPHDYRKAIRLMKQAEKFKRPVITFVDTPGAFPGVEAEQRGQHQLISDSLITMAGLKVPTIAFIIGEGGSGGALALALANKVYMASGAVYSILSPEGFATILYKDVNKKYDAAELMRLTADNLYEDGIIDGIVKENDNKIDLSDLKRIIFESLDEYRIYSPTKIISDRYKRFRRIGV
ncbi:acetyl-CoA carboxylase carboxyl transferase subunit alpha [Peptoniphilus sp. MSJ-1]|uniref:Acetyl-CoA carboxylase carboxyl transferase subunit alpha n=1 Tax=Peptoniphilus ovalis TaxID=2841503 RepID=A0ABS6FEP0_9FIRM|nr:carboxyl transferase domain-containing protein [Peptoniphilus ovalis]MBU5668654.1 acetyl-CoA carboxylase carboxyl transferase subunit alpha [Peptoniphilus ovalis]